MFNYMQQHFFVYNARYTKAAATPKTDEDLLKGARKYTRTARKAWEAMAIPQNQEVDFGGTLRSMGGLVQTATIVRNKENSVLCCICRLRA